MFVIAEIFIQFVMFETLRNDKTGCSVLNRVMEIK